MLRRHHVLALATALLAGAAAPALAQRGDDDGEFLILQARYGTERNHVDVTDRLREMARRDRRMRLTNDLFGVDPDPGHAKRMRILARGPRGGERSFEYAENSWVDGALFTGWRHGDWGR